MAEMIADIVDDHTRVLALARLAIALETGDLWGKDPEHAADRHGSACDALWRELRRLVEMADGQVPVLKHPSVEAQEFAYRVRSQLRDVVGAAVDDAVQNFQFET